MPRKSWLDLIWPVAGIDRSANYQNQPPYTTPDALNVRAEDPSEYRNRGGSRPGLGLALRTKLAGEIRLLTKVAVLKAQWPTKYVSIFGNNLEGGLTRVSYKDPPTLVTPFGSSQGANSYLSGADWALAWPGASLANRDTSQDYEATFFLRPPAGKAMVGTASIYLLLPDELDDPLEESVELTLTFTATDYKASIIRHQGGVVTSTLHSALQTDDIGMGGAFTAKFDAGSGGVDVYWRRKQVLSQLVSGPYLGHDMAVAVVSADQSIEATKMTTDFGWFSDQPKDYKSLRRDLLVAVSEGNLYREDSSNTLVLVGSDVFNPEAELTAVDREQKLYIADYGAAISGQGASIAYPALNQLSAPGQNFTGAGIDNQYTLELVDSNYVQNEKQQLQILNADGGTYRLGFQGGLTSPIPWNTQGNGIQSYLEQVATIGVGQVAVTGLSSPYIIEFKGTLAGENLELLSTENSLTNSNPSAPAPTVSVSAVQSGAKGDFLVGSYTISAVGATTIDFAPALTLSPDWTQAVSNVSFRIVVRPKIYDPHDDSIEPHVASKGSTPAGCRLVALYRDRIVYAGSDAQPHVWFMSRQGDPFDWDYTQEDSGAAIFAQASIGGMLAEPITALVPHGDECLIVGCYNSLWMIRGDPGFGGTQDQISRKIGIVGPHAWCKTPDDMLVFLSADGLYAMAAGCHGFPSSLSRERLPADLVAQTQERAVLSMEYDTLHRGIHIFATPYDDSQGSHWWFDWEAKSFWRVQLDKDHEPFAIHEQVAWDDMPRVLIGGRDGYVRYFSRDFEQDDQDKSFESYCFLGPFHIDREGYMEGIVTKLVGTLGEHSGPVNWDLYVADSAQRTLSVSPRETGTWSRTGLNYTHRPRARGVAGLLKVSGASAKRWFLERITAVVRSAGERRVD
jgi:hypothetical protein